MSDEHRKSLVIVEVDNRLLYRATGWWLQFGGRTKSDLYCIHEVKLNAHCSICALKTTK